MTLGMVCCHDILGKYRCFESETGRFSVLIDCDAAFQALDLAFSHWFGLLQDLPDELFVSVSQALVPQVNVHETHALATGEGLCRSSIQCGQIKASTFAHDEGWPDIGTGCVHHIEFRHVLSRDHHVTQEQVVVLKAMLMHVFDSTGHFFDELGLLLFTDGLVLLVEPVTGEVVHAHGLRDFFGNNEGMDDATGKTMIAPGNQLRNTQTPAGKFLQVLVFSADH